MAKISNRQSYLAKQDASRKSRIAAGLLGDKFPEVQKIHIDMVYLQNLSNPVLMLRKVNFFPTSYAYFKMDCMIKECDGGFFDIGPVIRGMIKERKKTLKDSMKCKGGLNRKALGPDHATIEFEINISFHRRGQEPPRISDMEEAPAPKAAPKKKAPAEKKSVARNVAAKAARKVTTKTAKKVTAKAAKKVTAKAAKKVTAKAVKKVTAKAVKKVTTKAVKKKSKR